MRKLFPLAALVLVGCYSDPGKNPEPVEVSGKVMLTGRAVSDVFLNLQPTGTGNEARLSVKNGEFKGQVTPGRYTYYITEDSKKPAAFQSIPDKYRAGSLDRQIDIDGGTTLTITLD